MTIDEIRKSNFEESWRAFAHVQYRTRGGPWLCTTAIALPDTRDGITQINELRAQTRYFPFEFRILDATFDNPRDGILMQ